MNEVIDYFVNIIRAIVNWLFDLGLVSGVSFGSFCVACLVLSVAISFIFTKLVGSVK